MLGSYPDHRCVLTELNARILPVNIYLCERRGKRHCFSLRSQSVIPPSPSLICCHGNENSRSAELDTGWPLQGIRRVFACEGPLTHLSVAGFTLHDDRGLLLLLLLVVVVVVWCGVVWCGVGVGFPQEVNVDNTTKVSTSIIIKLMTSQNLSGLRIP